MRKLCARHNWPVIDVTRRSIEETAAAIINLLQERAEAAERHDLAHAAHPASGSAIRAQLLARAGLELLDPAPHCR